MKEIKHKKRRRLIKILLIVAVLLVAIRIALPYIILKYVNKSLNELPDYRGHVEDIDLAIIRGAYQIEGIKLEKITGKVKEPFFECPEIDLSVHWGAIFQGEIVGEVSLLQPKLNFVNGPTPEQSQTEIAPHWTEVVKDLMPLKLNLFKIENGELRFIDKTSTPKVDLKMTSINIQATNLSNSTDSKELLPATVDGGANVYGGTVNLHMKMAPVEKDPTFDLNAEVKNLNLVQLNDFLRAYGNFDVNKGTFGLYTEIAAKKGRFEGYVKPVIKDLDVLAWKQEKGSFLQKSYEAVVALAGQILENNPKQQIATKAPLSGSFDNPSPDIWRTIGSLLRNAFIQALYPSIDNSVSITGTTQEEQKGLFGRMKERREERKEEKKKDK